MCLLACYVFFGEMSTQVLSFFLYDRVIHHLVL
jgi:hypothetical protein